MGMGSVPATGSAFFQLSPISPSAASGFSRTEQGMETVEKHTYRKE